MTGSKLTPRLFRNTFKDERGHKICPLLESAGKCVSSCITNTALRIAQCAVIALRTAHCTLHSVHCTHAQITTVSEDATHRKLSQGGYCNLLNWPWLFHNPFKESSLHILFVVLSQIKAFSIVFMGFLCHEMEITRRGIYLANEIIMPKALQTGITIPGITIPDKGGKICKGLDYS